MAYYVEYPTEEGRTILVEVDEAAPVAKGVVPASRGGEKAQEVIHKVQTRFEDAMEVVHRNAQTIIGKVKGLSEPPDEVEVTFGLKAAGEFGSFAVAKASAEANYTVKLVWKREEAS
jgi:hypothetical protein